MLKHLKKRATSNISAQWYKRLWNSRWLEYSSLYYPFLPRKGQEFTIENFAFRSHLPSDKPLAWLLVSNIARTALSEIQQWSFGMVRVWWYHFVKPNITQLRIHWDYLNFRNNWNYAMYVMNIQGAFLTKIIGISDPDFHDSEVLVVMWNQIIGIDLDFQSKFATSAWNR